MIACPSCQTSNPAGAAFCGSCGNQLSGAPTVPASANKGFWASLFDMSFSVFITVRMVQLLYWIALIVLGLSAISVFIALASQSGGAAIVGLVLAPLTFFTGAIFLRVYLETIIVLFKIAENTGEVAAAGRQRQEAKPPEAQAAH
jgi:hypothetical protein